jgi:hypothetical protein
MPDTNLTTALSHLRDISPALLVASPTLQRASKKAIDIVINPATEKERRVPTYVESSMTALPFYIFLFIFRKSYQLNHDLHTRRN